MELQKTHPRKFIVLGIMLLALLVAVASISLGYKATNAHAASAYASFSVTVTSKKIKSISMAYTQDRTVKSPCFEAGQPSSVNNVDPNTHVNLRTFDQANCVWNGTDPSLQDPIFLGGAGSSQSVVCDDILHCA